MSTFNPCGVCGRLGYFYAGQRDPVCIHCRSWAARQRTPKPMRLDPQPLPICTRCGRLWSGHLVEGVCDRTPCHEAKVAELVWRAGLLSSEEGIRA